VLPVSPDVDARESAASQRSHASHTDTAVSEREDVPRPEANQSVSPDAVMDTSAVNHVTHVCVEASTVTMARDVPSTTGLATYQAVAGQRDVADQPTLAPAMATSASTQLPAVDTRSTNQDAGVDRSAASHSTHAVDSATDASPAVTTRRVRSVLVTQDAVTRRSVAVHVTSAQD